MNYTQTEYLAVCRDLFDFVLKSAERYHADHPEESYSQILRKRTLLSYVLRETSSECEVFPEMAEAFLMEADSDFTAAAEKYREKIPELASRNAEGACSWNPQYAPGMSLRWSDPHPDLPENWCIFHMWNGCRPQSFLSDKRYFAECFMKIMEESVRKYPQYDTLYTFSWLLSEPRFQEFFPDEWHQNMSEKHQGIHANLGFLGQFLTARMTLNRKTAAQYLETGRLPYQPCSSHCSFERMKEHLISNFLN